VINTFMNSPAEMAAIVRKNRVINSSNNKQEILSGENLVKNILGENREQMFDSIQENMATLLSQETPGTNSDNDNLIINKPMIDRDSTEKARSYRTINK
ncbi:7043_t:CDS:2, partial [Gigaspora margarita]